MLRPAGRVCLYLPKRSTMPARAWGTIRTVLASSTMTNRNSNASSINRAVMPSSFLQLGRSRLEGRDRVDVRRGAPDLEDLDGLPRCDGEVLVVRRRRPDLARQPDAARLHGRDLLGDDATLADELAVAEPELGAGVQPRA